MKRKVESLFDYDLNFRLSEIKNTYTFDASAQGSVPQAIRCFLESENLMQTIRNAVYLGGDMDTIADMAGALGEAAYGMNKNMAKKIMTYLPLEYQETIKEFYSTYFNRKL